MDLNLKGVGDAVPAAASWPSDLSDADIFTSAGAIFHSARDAVARPAPDALAQFDAG
jgi:hypothetical protein